jgi:hypothetical protein
LRDEPFPYRRETVDDVHPGSLSLRRMVNSA